MKRIYHYPLPITTRTAESVSHLELPKGAKVLAAVVAGGRPRVYVEVDDAEKEKEAAMLMLVMTGEPFVSDGFRYVGTIQLGQYVFHVYEFEKRGQPVQP